MLGAELQNSSFSSTAYMENVWPKLKAQKINTILANVTWEDIEPEERRYDFGQLDQNILAARKHGFHLVLLWFGAFKNGRQMPLTRDHANNARDINVCATLGQDNSHTFSTHVHTC